MSRIRGPHVRSERATSRLRALPDFVIFGASKSGTTSMYDYLGAHPLVVPCRAKELHFAEPAPQRGARRAVVSLVVPVAVDPGPGRAGPRRGTGPLRRGHADLSRHHRIGRSPAGNALVPDVALVALLREPGERAWSHYRMRDAAEGEAEADAAGFMAAIEAEGEELAGGWKPAEGRQSIRQGLLRQGHYAEELREWFDCFGSDQILLVRSEDLFADPATTYGVVCRHLGLPDTTPPTFGVANAGRPSDLPAEARRWLDDHFAGPNAELAELTGGAIGWP